MSNVLAACHPLPVCCQNVSRKLGFTPASNLMILLRAIPNKEVTCHWWHCGSLWHLPSYREVYQELFGTRRSDFLQRSPPRPASTCETRKSFPDPSNPSASRLQKVKDSFSFCHSQPSRLSTQLSPFRDHFATSSGRLKSSNSSEGEMRPTDTVQYDVWVQGTNVCLNSWILFFVSDLIGKISLLTANLQTSKTNIYRTRQNSSYVSCTNPSMVGLSGTPTPRHPFVSPHGRCRHWHTCCTWCVRRGLP